MIYLKNNTDKQDCFIPKNGEYVGKKTYKEGVEYQKSLIEPITITDNGVYENENGYNPVDVNIPFGSTTITENGVYDTRNGYVAKSDEVIGDYWQMQGGGFLFQLNSAYNNIKMQVLFKPSNEVGEYFPDLIRGIIGSYAQNFYIAEEIENPYKIFACVGDWQSEHIEITNDWHLLSLSKTEFTIDGKVVGIVPEGIDVAVTTIFLNGLYDTNSNNYFYPNLGEYSDVKIWCDDDLLFDCVYFYEGDQNGEYGYLNKVNNQLVTNNWKVTNNWLHIGYTNDYKLKNVRALDYIDVQVFGGDVNLINKDVVLENEVIVNIKANEEGVDGFREVNIDATPLKTKSYQYGYEDGLMNCPDCENLTELYVSENGVYEGAFNRVDVNVTDTNGSYDDGYNQGYQDGQANCEGEGGCNLEDKWITPSMGDRDGNGYVVTYPSEGFDGLSRVVINPQTIYNEGIEEGRNQSGEGGDCNIQNQKRIDLNSEWEVFYPDEGNVGIYEVVVDAGRKAEEWREEGRNEIRNDLKSIEITENGRYSVDDMELINYIEFDGNSYFDTNIPFGENSKIEVAITKTSFEEDEQIIGVAQYDLLAAEAYGGFGIVLGAGLTYGVFGKSKTNNIPFFYEEGKQILTLDRNGLSSSLHNDGSGWIDESGLNDSGLYGQTIGIGKIKSVSDGWAGRGLNGRIRYVKIWTDRNDDSTLVTFIPKNMAQGGFGLVNSEGTEYTYIENLGEGTATFISEYERKYGEGWKEINVNVTPKIIDYEGVKFGHSTFTDCPFNIDGRGNYDYMFYDCKKLVNAPIINTPINSAVYMFSGCESLVNGGDYDTSNATDLRGMYSGCRSLQYVGNIDCSSLPNREIGFGEEAQIFGTSQYIYLTDFGGFTNLKQRIKLQGLVSLNEQSVINIFNGLYDFVGNNETPNKVQGIITMSSFLTDIVEQHRTIAENKGWTITIE